MIKGLMKKTIIAIKWSIKKYIRLTCKVYDHMVNKQKQTSKDEQIVSMINDQLVMHIPISEDKVLSWYVQ